ncbi:MAG TPA: TonB-dependent receptor, partial [Luteolibacter sp.]|nr:TonB-dependent receptor [Luteolibacter sp.]
KPYPTPLRGTCWSALALIVLTATLRAATTAQLDPLIVSALRMPQTSSTVTSSVTRLEPEELEAQGLRQLQDAINLAPGVISTSTSGQSGATASLFMRGTTTAESLLVIDGIRMNGSGNQLGSLLAGARTHDLGALEILRGPQSAVYGGESVGGVIWMETPRGSGAPSARSTFEAGSFNTLAASTLFQGELGDCSYHLSGGYEETDNDAPLSAFHQGSTAMRVEAKVNPAWTVGSTWRSLDNRYENGGSSEDCYDSALATFYAVGQISEVWTTRFTLGYQQEAYDSVSSSGTYDTDLRAGTVAWDQELRISDTLRLLAGGFFHRDSYQSIADYPLFFFYSSADTTSNRYGAHAALELDAGDRFTHSAALRWEDYDSHGEEATWKLGSVCRIPESGTLLRGSVGTAFRAPTYLDLYYANNYGQTGNPGLESQTSLGWDLGIEQALGSHHQLELTWFRNLLDNAIDSYAFPSPVNIPGVTATEGIELGLRGDWRQGQLTYRLAWTHLDECLKDQPRNAATGSLQWQATAKTALGLGATHLASRSWGGDTIAACTVARLFASHQLTENVKLHARIENLFNEDYELSSFYGTTTPGAGTGVYAGVTVDW